MRRRNFIATLLLGASSGISVYGFHNQAQIANNPPPKRKVKLLNKTMQILDSERFTQPMRVSPGYVYEIDIDSGNTDLDVVVDGPEEKSVYSTSSSSSPSFTVKFEDLGTAYCHIESTYTRSQSVISNHKIFQPNRYYKINQNFAPFHSLSYTFEPVNDSPIPLRCQIQNCDTNEQIFSSEINEHISNTISTDSSGEHKIQFENHTSKNAEWSYELIFKSAVREYNIQYTVERIPDSIYNTKESDNN